ncbi:hypothetical protein ROZALSC1DRAFT_22382 [Rozella allomycis CSF55]|uniref:Uncharacterized protein n=1 Tax=Rozella allomycis (strain CSF55) TaxID=988480 RepID=A0A4P9YIV7_ROZAC|nr:hypothetical protein ROZALSC1DRAFT_22382 [Rozella allomycis CSF55]
MYGKHKWHSVSTFDTWECSAESLEQANLFTLEAITSKHLLHLCKDDVLLDLNSGFGCLQTYLIKYYEFNSEDLDFFYSFHKDSTSPTTFNIYDFVDNYKPEAIDAVVAFEVFNMFNIPDTLNLFKKLRACLAHGGYVLINVTVPAKNIGMRYSDNELAYYFTFLSKYL